MAGSIFNPDKSIPGLKPGLKPVLDPEKPIPNLPSTADLVGKGDDFKNGVYGSSKKHTGVVGESETFVGVSGDGPVTGVLGTSETGDGVVGEGRRGVVGESRTFQGVFGHSTENAGVVGESDIGVGVHGKGGRLAGFFEGDVEVTGDLRLANADCAEDFDIAVGDRVEPGTVMVLGDEGALHQSHQPYDKRVAGVISGAGDYKPGIILDKQQSRPNRQPVALLGKVYCKVDAQYASIEVGDLLTTSATPGHAMKAGEPLQAFGTVIGKALRPLKEGQGLIPILIALQ